MFFYSNMLKNIPFNLNLKLNTSNNTINTNLYKSDKEVALSLSLNEGDNIPEDSNLNSTLY